MPDLTVLPLLDSKSTETKLLAPISESNGSLMLRNENNIVYGAIPSASLHVDAHDEGDKFSPEDGQRKVEKLPTSRNYSRDAKDSTSVTTSRHVRTLSAPAAFSSGNRKQYDSHRSRSHSSSSALAVARSFGQDILSEIKESLRIRLKKLGQAHPKVAESYNQIGTFHFRHGDFENASHAYYDALKCYRLAAQKEMEESDSFEACDYQIEIAATMVNLGTLYWRTGRIVDSIGYLEEALKIQRKLCSSRTENSNEKSNESVECARTLYNIGIARSLQGEYGLAMQAHTRALDIWESTYGSLHADVARTLDAQGKIYVLQGDVDEAIKCHSQALKIKKALMGSMHSSVLFSMLNVAETHKIKGEFEEAIKIYRHVIRIQMDISRGMKRGGSSEVSLVEIGHTLHELALVMFMSGATAKALQESENALKFYRDGGLSDSDPRIVSLIRSIDEAYSNFA